MTSTSWEPVSHWYDQTVGQAGHYYHDHVVIPGVLRLLNLLPNTSILDLACGQGVLARHLPPTVKYTGVDASSTLIKSAKSQSSNIRHQFFESDISQPITRLTGQLFNSATIILALQNLERPDQAVANAAKHLKPQGKLVIVLNHPCFRIPRQSSWETDPQNKLQYRRLNRYLSPLKIPISAHPGQTKSPVTWSFHLPLQSYFQFLKSAGFVIETLEEWASDKQSTGKNSRPENRARSEFPLFLALTAIKKA